MEADAHSAVPWTDLLRANLPVDGHQKAPNKKTPVFDGVFFLKTRKEWDMKIPYQPVEFTGFLVAINSITC